MTKRRSSATSLWSSEHKDKDDAEVIWMHGHVGQHAPDAGGSSNSSTVVYCRRSLLNIIFISMSPYSIQTGPAYTDRWICLCRNAVAYRRPIGS